MEVKRKTVAGTLESSDVFVEVAPNDGVEIYVESVVYDQFGKELESLVAEILAEFDVNGAKVSLNDRGALECTVRARVEAALKRAETEE